MSFRFRDNIESLAGYTPGYQPSSASVVKLNTNENPYPASPKVFEALGQLGEIQLRRYPPILWDEFRAAAGEVHGLDPEMVMAGNGGDELLTILTRCCCDAGRAMAYPAPTYSLYPTLAAIQGAPVVEAPFGDDYGIPAELAGSGAQLTILCNPNAPSGTLVSVEAVAKLAGQVEGVLLVDEAYVDFAPDNCVRLLKEFDNLVILRSMSKGYSLAGMRFGYVLASRRIIATMIKVKDSYNVNVASQVAATAAIKDQDYFCANVRKIVAERERLTAALRGGGFELADSHTNFLLVRSPAMPAEEVYEQLRRREIYIRYFGGREDMAEKLRITVGTPQENNALLGALREILS